MNNPDLLNNLDFKWPKKGDKVFSNNHGCDNTAFVGPSRVDWMLMAEGYIRSAELAVEHCQSFERNLVIYPVVFQVRHSIELSLKHLLLIALELFNEPIRRSKNHELLPLWHEIRPFIERRWPENTTGEIPVVESMIKELHKADQRSEKFRYPVSREGTLLMKDDSVINLKEFIDSGRKVFNFLNGCSFAILDDLERKRDFELNASDF
jgi:hypothetical protein